MSGNGAHGRCTTGASLGSHFGFCLLVCSNFKGLEITSISAGMGGKGNAPRVKNVRTSHIAVGSHSVASHFSEILSSFGEHFLLTPGF